MTITQVTGEETSGCNAARQPPDAPPPQRRAVGPLRFAPLGVLGVVLLLFVRSGGFSESRPFSTNPVEAKYGFSLDRFYPNLLENEVDQLLEETWTRPLAGSPETGFKEAPYQGTYVTVNRNGFREVPDQGPWPPQRDRYFTIFLFGGSTTFNYGVPDGQTIAAYLQQRLARAGLPRPPKVYNFGVAFYMSIQERQLFEALVRQGTVPDAAIFLDGMNDFHYTRGEVPQAPHVDQMVVPGPMHVSPLFEGFKRSPLGNYARTLRNRVLGFYTRTHPAEQTTASQAERGLSTKLVGSIVKTYYNNPRLLQRVIEGYLANKRSIEALAAQAGVRPLFVWQPVPTYKYDLRLHPFASDGFGHHTYSIFGYPLMATYVRDHPIGPNFLWCADLQIGATEPLYVDKVHYSAKLSELVAGCIAQGLGQQEDSALTTSTSASTALQLHSIPAP